MFFYIYNHKKINVVINTMVSLLCSVDTSTTVTVWGQSTPSDNRSTSHKCINILEMSMLFFSCTNHIHPNVFWYSCCCCCCSCCYYNCINRDVRRRLKLLKLYKSHWVWVKVLVILEQNSHNIFTIILTKSFSRFN